MSSLSWRVLFFVSAAVNILVLGAAAGFFAGGGFKASEATEAPGAALQSPRQMLAVLPPSLRAQVRRDFVRAWSAARAEREALRDAQTEVVALMRAETYDAEAMRAALVRQRSANAAVTAIVHDELADAFASLTPEQRRAATEAIVEWRSGLGQSRQGDPAVLGEEAIPVEGEAPVLRDAPPAGGQAPRREELRERFREKLRERREQQQ